MLVLQLGSAAADGYFTDRNAQYKNFVEHDWFSRPFVTHSAFERRAYFGVWVGTFIAGGEIAEHYHHDYIGLLIRGYQIQENVRGATYSARH